MYIYLIKRFSVKHQISHHGLGKFLVNLPIMDEWMDGWMDGCEVGGTWHCILWIRRYGVPWCFLFVVFIPQGKGNTDGQYGDVLCDVGDKTWFNIQEIKAWRVALPLAGSALMNLLFYILSSTQPEKISKETPRQRIVTLTHWQLWKFRTPSALCFLYTVLSQCCFLQCVHVVSCNVFTTLNLMSLYPILQIALSRHFSVYIVLHVCIFIYIYIIYILIFVECLWDHPVLHS